MPNDAANSLNYCRVVLLRSAILVDCDQPIELVESRDNRIVVTARTRAKRQAMGATNFKFLWREVDGTSAKDVPLEALASSARRFAPVLWHAQLDKLPWDNAGSEALDLYKRFTAEDVDNERLLCPLGLKLVGGGYLSEAMDLFERCEKHAGTTLNKFTALVWLGHLLDLQGRRGEALGKYRAALEMPNQGNMQHDQWGITINREWVQERLQAPFDESMLGK